MNKKKVAVIGTGQIGQLHIEWYKQLDDIELAAICDTNLEKAKTIAMKWDIPDVYNDYTELLKREDICAVDVCLHNILHAKVTIDALHAGKHVYCEKPIANTYKDACAMVIAAKESGRMLHIQLGELYKPYARAVKRLVDGDALGEIYHGRCMFLRRRFRPYVDGYGTPNFVKKEHAGGGALYDIGVYQLSLLLYLMDMPRIQNINGTAYQKTGMDEIRRKESGYNVEELAVGFLRFENGITMDVFESWAAHIGQMEPCAILGSKGGVRFNDDIFSYHTTMCDLELDCTGDLDAMDWRWCHTQEKENYYTSSQKHWVAALNGKVELLPTAELALQTMLISEGIYLSSDFGREVTAEEVKRLSGTYQLNV